MRMRGTRGNRKMKTIQSAQSNYEIKGGGWHYRRPGRRRWAWQQLLHPSLSILDLHPHELPFLPSLSFSSILFPSFTNLLSHFPPFLLPLLLPSSVQLLSPSPSSLIHIHSLPPSLNPPLPQPLQHAPGSSYPQPTTTTTSPSMAPRDRRVKLTSTASFSLFITPPKAPPVLH